MWTNIDNTLFITLLTIPSLFESFPLEDDNAIEETSSDVSYLGNRVFKQPDPEVGKSLESWNETHPVNPEEFGEYAEGDIIFPQRSRNGLIGETFRWNGGVVPYEISGIFPPGDVNTIVRAIGIYSKYTCISFRPRQLTDKDYVSIVNGPTGCWSSVGRISGKQEVNLQSPYCTTKVGTPLHELMHAIGFLHEQNRYERDDYVTISWQNIKKGHETNFDKANKETTTGYGIPYDFRSVMHYSNTAFSTNGRATIVPKDSGKVEKMGQRDGFSKGDITKINAMYGCPEKTANLGNGGHSSNSSPPKGNEGNGGSNNLIAAAGNFLSSLFTS